MPETRTLFSLTPFLLFCTSLFIPSPSLWSNMFYHRNFSLPLPSCPLPPSVPPPHGRLNNSRGARAGPQKSLLSFRTIFSSSSVLCSTTFPSLQSCSLYALSPIGLQSPVSDQSGASVTCSCVYCQHRPVLGQLGEQEKARQ